MLGHLDLGEAHPRASVIFSVSGPDLPLPRGDAGVVEVSPRTDSGGLGGNEEFRGEGFPWHLHPGANSEDRSHLFPSIYLSSFEIKEKLGQSLKYKLKFIFYKSKSQNVVSAGRSKATLKRITGSKDTAGCPVINGTGFSQRHGDDKKNYKEPCKF